MKFIPFPPTIAATSAKSAKAQNEARKGKGMKGHSDKDRACYRDPDGRLHMAYDPYNPQHPIGATPGLGTVHARVGHYANDTSGYTFTVSDFIPAEEILNDRKTWSDPAIAFDFSAEHGAGRFSIAPSEALLEAMLEDYENATRPSIINVSSPDRIEPGSAVFMNPAFKEVVVIGEANAIAGYLVGKYDVEMPSPGAARAYHLNRPVDGSCLADSRLSMICESLRDRYTFSFEHATPGNLEISPVLSFESEPEVLETPGL
jgi:hypothetical protein